MTRKATSLKKKKYSSRLNRTDSNINGERERGGGETETDRQTDRETETEAETERDGERDRDSDSDRDRETDRQTDRRTATARELSLLPTIHPRYLNEAR